MKIIVTGGAGFIGSHIVDALVSRKDQVLVIDDLSSGLEENVPSSVKLIKMDIRDQGLAEVFSKFEPEATFHCAAQKNVRKSVDDPSYDADVNIIGSLNVIQQCQRLNSKVIFTSTGGALYGDAQVLPTPETYDKKPLSPYGIAKFSVEEYLRYYQSVHGLKSISLRLANVYGPRQDPKGEAGVVAIFLHKLLTGQTPIINGDGTQTRDYVYVADVVKAAMAVLTTTLRGTYNVGTGIATSVNELYETIRHQGNFAAEATHGQALSGEQKTSCLDRQKITDATDWQPTFTLKTGLAKTIDWFRDKYHV
ncbi:NAD-dependent epimerase/dehydratase family protein [Patescibacteria group bacterium]